MVNIFSLDKVSGLIKSGILTKSYLCLFLKFLLCAQFCTIIYCKTQKGIVYFYFDLPCRAVRK